MRCPDCNRFVSLDTQEPEEQTEPTVTNNDNGSATIAAEYTVDRNCGECSQQLKQGNIDFEITVDLDPEKEAGDASHAEHSLSIDDVEVQMAEESYPKPREVKSRKTGKMEMRYPNPRYTRTEIGAQLSIPASSFEEQV